MTTGKFPICATLVIQVWIYDNRFVREIQIMEVETKKI